MGDLKKELAKPLPEKQGMKKTAAEVATKLPTIEPAHPNLFKKSPIEMWEFQNMFPFHVKSEDIRHMVLDGQEF
jgi:hypothetical protein